MLGWVLKRGLENASGAKIGPDDTQIDQPDTPAPVFAARAFKTALFGTPAPARTILEEEVDKALAKTSNPSSSDSREPKSPSKPTGILLTPGTGTARRKRVSFGHDVRDNAGKNASKSGIPDECPGKFPSPWTGNDDGVSKRRPRTKLTEAMENSRRQGSRSKTDAPQPSKQDANDDDEEGAWEEVDELDRDPDITVDLNEPHSRSGKYWKSEFQRYHEDAKVEMDKLVKYKQLAKSYAQMKDAESLDLNEKLREEQQKVVTMETRLSELAGQIARKRMKGSDQDNHDMIRDLTRQTALAVQYRSQVKELEALVKKGQPQHYDTGSKRQTTSPRTHKTLLETQRELRRARDQVKELSDVKDELRRAKSTLRSTQHQERKLESDNKRLAADLAKSTSKMEELGNRVKAAEETSRQKERELGDLRREHEILKSNAMARVTEAEQVLRRKNNQISDLRRKTSLSKAPDLAIPDADKFHSDTEEAGAWKPSLLERQTKLKADQERRTREREIARLQLEEIINTPSSNGSRGRVASPDLDDICLPSIAFLDDDKPESPALDPGRLGKSRNMPSNSHHPKKRSSPAPLDLYDQVEQDIVESLHLGKREFYREHELKNEKAFVNKVRAEPIEGRPVLERALKERSAASFAPRHVSQRGAPDISSPVIDLLDGKFARLGGPDVNSSAAWTANTSKGNLPADRRAAALARLEQKRVERKRAHGDLGYNKENVRP